MILKNLTTRKIICRDLKICKSFIDRSFGLLIKSNPPNLLFKTRFGIHTLLLKRPIDVVILDDKMKVVRAKSNLEPGRFFFWNPGYSTVIELKPGTIKKYRITPETQLSLHP